MILITSLYDMKQIILTKKRLFPKFQLIIQFNISKLSIIMRIFGIAL